MASYFLASWSAEDCNCSSETCGDMIKLKQLVEKQRELKTKTSELTHGENQTLLNSTTNSNDSISRPSDTAQVSPTVPTTDFKSQKKRKRVDIDCLDPIVYFNVEGEIIPILRSTILRVIPDSQLAVRVSGR
jgi:hypothetical protein